MISSASADLHVVAVAMVLAVLTCHLALTSITEIGGADARANLCATLQHALALGTGLWATSALLALAFAPTESVALHADSQLVRWALGIAAASCAIAVARCLEPGAPAIAGGSLGFSIASAITGWAAVAQSPGRLAPSSGAVWTRATGAAVLVFAGLAAGLLLDRRRAPRRWSIPLRVAAVLTMACGLLACGLIRQGPRALRAGSLALRACCGGESLDPRLLAASVASLAGAVLALTQMAAVYRRRMRERSNRGMQELSEAHARLHHLATHDALTGLANRELLKERLSRALAEVMGTGQTVVVAVIDLDHFSIVNHSLGHGVGDRLLEEIARRLESAVPREHTLARIGGDEFAVLIKGVAARVEATAVTLAASKAFDAPVHIGGDEVRIHPSIGVSVWPDDARRDDDLLAHAEAALQVAKRSGSRKVLFFEAGMSDSMQERLALENDLRRALATGEFEVFYHPQLSCRTGRIVAAEALLRWRHPSKGIIKPNSFIPLAEQTGLIVPLGEWALREVCRQAREWRVNTGSAPRAAINLSAAQLRHDDVLQVIRAALGAADLDPRALEIELTESTLMTNPEQSTAVLEKLRAMGVGVAIDDFGTGYSSLSYLRHLPIDKLKIDRSFIRDLPASSTDAFIVRAVVSLARSVGLQVVIEGVETVEQLEFIRSLECDQWQGYYCCEPLSAASFQDMLLEQTVTRTGIIDALARASRRLTP